MNGKSTEKQKELGHLEEVLNVLKEKHCDLWSIEHIFNNVVLQMFYLISNYL